MGGEVGKHSYHSLSTAPFGVSGGFCCFVFYIVVTDYK